VGNNSDPKFIFRLSRFPVYRGSVLGRFYCIRRRYWNCYSARIQWQNRRRNIKRFQQQ